MQLTINTFRPLFPDKIFSNISLTFSIIPDISLTAVKFLDISRFSTQVVTLDNETTVQRHIDWQTDLWVQSIERGRLQAEH